MTRKLACVCFLFTKGSSAMRFYSRLLLIACSVAPIFSLLGFIASPGHARRPSRRCELRPRHAHERGHELYV